VKRGAFTSHDSLLSGSGARFEYGFSTTDRIPRDLGGPVRRLLQRGPGRIDQFISSGEAKWGRSAVSRCSCPRAEGRAPSIPPPRPNASCSSARAGNAGLHSSTRGPDVPDAAPADASFLGSPDRADAEEPLRHRAVQLAAVRARWRGGFQLLIPEVDPSIRPGSPHRVLRGKVYFDLLEDPPCEGLPPTLPSCASSSCTRFPPPSMPPAWPGTRVAREIVWCQEEPQNQGAWYQIGTSCNALQSGQQVFYAGRRGAAAPRRASSSCTSEHSRRRVRPPLLPRSIEHEH